MTDRHSTTVEAAAAWAREDGYDDRPTLADEVLADEREDDGEEDE